MAMNSQMREYETIYIIKPNLDDKKAEQLINEKKDFIEKLGGKNIQVSAWGRRKLAWERKKETRGIFVHHRFLGLPGITTKFDRSLSIDDQILHRHSVVLACGVDPETVEVLEDSLSFAQARERREYDGRRQDYSRNDDNDYDPDMRRHNNHDGYGSHDDDND